MRWYSLCEWWSKRVLNLFQCDTNNIQWLLWFHSSDMSVKVSQIFSRFSQIFVYFGITHSITATDALNSATTLWMGFISLTLISSLVAFASFHDQLLSNTGALSTAIDAFQLISPIVCHFILILESLFAVAVIERMWQLVTRIELLLITQDEGEINNKNGRFYKQFLLKFLFSQLLPIAVESYITLSIGKAEEWQRHWIARTFSFNANRLAALHFILWVDYLTSLGGYLSDALARISRRSGGGQLKMDYLDGELKRLKNLYILVWRLTQDVNGRFKWFLLSTTTNLFLSITIDFYWIYGNFRFGGNPFAFRESQDEWEEINYSIETYFILLLESVICVIPPIITTCYVFHSCQGLMSALQSIPRNLHGIRRRQNQATSELVGIC